MNHKKPLKVQKKNYSRRVERSTEAINERKQKTRAEFHAATNALEGKTFTGPNRKFVAIDCKRHTGSKFNETLSWTL